MNTNKTNYAFMAFGKGVETKESVNSKKFIGIAPVYVIGINPTKSELEKIYNTNLEKEPVYVSEVESGEDKHKVKSVRIEFIVKTDPNHCNGIENINRLTFFLRNEGYYNNDKTKIQVIDKYGRTAWATIEEAKNHDTMLTKNDGSKYQANIDKDYRPAYVGEAELTEFLIAYLNIPSVMKYVNNTWVMVDNPENCEARLENIDKYFSGNVKELKDIIALQPNNRVRVLYGIKNANESQFQYIYNRKFLKFNNTNYVQFEKKVTNARVPENVEVEFVDLKEYNVTPTNITDNSNSVSDLPFAESATASPWEF